MSTALAESIDFTATDFTGQKTVKATNVRRDATVSEVVRSLVPKLGLLTRDAKGNPVTYRVHHDRRARALFPSERIGDALEPGDSITLQRYVQAG